MRGSRQLVGYVMALTLVLISLAFLARYGVVEAARYIPVAAAHTSVADRSAELASGPVFRAADAQPVWIAPTPKYQYDPKLMEIKPRQELMKEAERRRANELASFQARKREAQLKRDRSLRQAREAFASAHAQRGPDFLLFPFIR